MQSKEKISKLKEELPIGAQSEIARIIGITPAAVNHFFRKGKVNTNNAKKILKEAIKIWKKHQKEIDQLLKEV